MITVAGDRLEFYFNEVHWDAYCTIEFQRTLRVPDDDRDYPLPAGLGAFPLRQLDDYAARLPEEWRGRGGVMAPMHQAEAMWIQFASQYPFAVKVATGKSCAITGDAWVDHLRGDPQDYVVLPDQPWLDGCHVGKGVVRQFVAMPLGEGYTVEEQLTGAAVHGGLQLVVYPLKGERYEPPPSRLNRPAFVGEPAMSHAPGGLMRQDIYGDPHGLDAWDQGHGSRCFVSLVNSAQWMAITGERPPAEPPTPQAYASCGLPWFDYYGSDSDTGTLRALASVAKHAKAAGQAPPPDNETIAAPDVVILEKPRGRRVQDGIGSS